ncbi:MAG: FAD-dependent oxidoreductase [SAR324 cluster bacterium]|nr:FAD-dependent oxidoreductase [SAR324 cluster bacterium]
MNETKTIFRIAIIGSGPAAFYAADELLKQTDMLIEIDMFEKLLTPYGLVRGGVAPDHQNIKAVTKIYERIAGKSGFRFFGNVTLGVDLQKEELLPGYHAVLYAVGAQGDRKLDIPGEDLAGSYSARDFVGWYNAHPDYRECQFDLSVKRVAIIGLGNVALDVARILGHSPAELAKTDIADYAQAALKTSTIEDIYIIGRRGPVQAAFTPAELRELRELEACDVRIDPEEMVLEDISLEELSQAHRNVQLHMDILKMIAETPPGTKPRRIHFMFKRSPLEVQGNQRVERLKLARNELILHQEQVKIQLTENYQELEVDCIFRAVGYRGTAIPGVAFDPIKSVIPNRSGRVIDPETLEILPGEYVAGWAKRGPSGVVGTNKHDAQETVHHLLEDLKNPVHHPEETNRGFAESLLNQKKIEFATFTDWKVLDDAEKSLGEQHGKPREKFSEVDQMLDVIRHRDS